MAKKPEHPAAWETPYPAGSTLNHPAVQAAFKALGSNDASSAQVGVSPYIRPNGSAFNDPRVAQGVARISKLAEDQKKQEYYSPIGVGATNKKHPVETSIMQRSIEVLGKLAAQREQVNVEFKRGNGSAITSESIQTLGKLAEQQQNVEFKRGNGSAITSESIQTLGKLAEQQQNVEFKRSNGSAITSESIQTLGKLAEQMHQIQIGVSQFKRENGSNINEKTAPQIDAVAKTEIRNTALYTIHNALNGGEISPEMLARWDQPRYKNGCESLLNMIPMPQGGITKRPGFEHIASLNSTRSHERLIPFIFSASNSRILEFHGSSSTTTAGLTIWFPGGQKYNAFSEDGKLPYKKEHIARLRVAQSYDVIYIAHPSYPPAKIMRESDGGVNDSGDPVDQKWTYEVIKWTPDIAAPSIFRIDMEGEPAAGEKVQTTYKYRVTAIDAFTGEESLVSGAKSIKAYALSQTYYPRIIVDYPTDKIKPNGATEAGYAAEFRVYKYRGGVYGFIGNITETSSVTYTVNNKEVTETRWAFEDKNIEPDTEDTPPTKNNPFNGSGKYPSIVFLHQQRLGFAASNSRPMTIWLSQAGNYENMSASLPPEDDDSIEVTLSESQANKILWCQSDRDALAVGTEGGEWLLSGTDGAAITPSDLAFKPQTYHGSQAGVNVLRAGSTLLYLQRGGKVVREFGYAFSTDKYESNDLSLLARHILRGTSVKAWAWQAEPYGIVWCVLGNGNLAGLTYMREHDVVGWHRHNSKDGEDYANFIDIAAIPGSDGNTQIWTIAQRSGTYRMERLHSFFNGGSASDAFHTDGSSKATFNARCKPTLPEAQLNNGTTFLKIRKFNAIKCRVIHSSPFYARVGSETKMPVPLRGASYVSGHADWALPLGAGWRENEGIELIFDGSDPVTVLGIVTTVEVADMSGNQQL